MASIWSVIFALLMMVQFNFHIVQSHEQHQRTCPLHIAYFCSCYSSEPDKIIMVKMCLNRSGKTVVCEPCPVKQQTYLNCSGCSEYACPVCFQDDYGLKELYKSEFPEAYPYQHAKDYYTSDLGKSFTTTPSSSYKMTLNESYSPSSQLNGFKIGSRNLSESDRKFLSNALKIVKMLENRFHHEPFKSIHDKFMQNSHVRNGTNDKPSGSRYRRSEEEIKKNEEDIFEKTDKDVETAGEIVTKRSMDLHGSTSTHLPSLIQGTVTKDFRRQRKLPAGKKHFRRQKKIDQHPKPQGGKKHRKIHKKLEVVRYNQTNPNGDRNKTNKHTNRHHQAKFKNADLAKVPHPKGSSLFHEQRPSNGSRFDGLSGNSSYTESDKVNATNASKDDFSSSEFSGENVSETSSFPRDTESTENSRVSSSFVKQRFSEQISENSSTTGTEQFDVSYGIHHREMSEMQRDERKLPSQLHDGQPTESSLELSSSTENTGNNSFLYSNISQGMMLSNEFSYSSPFPIGHNMTKETYREDNQTAETNDGAKNFSIMPSYTSGEQQGKRNVPSTDGIKNSFENGDSVNADVTEIPLSNSVSVERFFDHTTDQNHFGDRTSKINELLNIGIDHGINTDNSTNISLSVTEEESEKTNLSVTSEEVNFANESPKYRMPDGAKNKSLETSYQSDSNFATDQHLIDNVTSEKMIESFDNVNTNSTETVNNVKNTSSENTRRERLGYTDLSTSVQGRYDGIGSTKSGTSDENFSSMLSSLSEEHSSDYTMEKETTGNSLKLNVTTGSNGEQRSDSHSTLSSRMAKQESKLLNSPITGENENRDAEILNSGNVTDSLSNISSSENGTETHLADDVTSEYKLEENQTFGINTKVDNFAIVSSRLPDEQIQKENLQTFVDSKSDSGKEMNVRNPLVNSGQSNENETNQSILIGETSKLTIDGNGTTVENANESSEEIAETNLSHEKKKNAADSLTNLPNFGERQGTLKRSAFDYGIKANARKHGDIESDKKSRHSNTIRIKRDHLVANNDNENIETAIKILNSSNQNLQNVLSNLSQGQSAPKIHELTPGVHSKDINFDVISSGGSNSSNFEKNQNVFYNGRTENSEQVDKAVFKSNNNRITNKSQNAHGRGFSNHTDHFSMSHFDEEHRGLPELIKAKLNSDGYRKDAKYDHQLETNTHLFGHNKNSQISNLSEVQPELTKWNSPPFENTEKHGTQVVGVNQTILHMSSENRHHPLQMSVSSLERPEYIPSHTRMNAGYTENKDFDPKFRTGRKLLQFSKTSRKKKMVAHFKLSRSGRNRREAKDYPHNEWCAVPDDVKFGSLECNIWTYQKVCVMTCTDDNNIQGSVQPEFKCLRKTNVWEPNLKSCVDDSGRMEDFVQKPSQNIAAEESHDSPPDSKKPDKSPGAAPPGYDYSLDGGEEYDEYEYKEVEGGNHLNSDRKSSGQKSPLKTPNNDLPDYAYNDLTR